MVTFQYILSKIIYYLQWLIFIKVLSSWFIRDPNNPIYQLLEAITEPFIGPIRRILPRSSMGIDFSPLLAIILLNILSNLIN